MSSLLLMATLLPVILNFGCILIYIFYRKCRARQQEEGSADWDDVIWFRGEETEPPRSRQEAVLFARTDSLLAINPAQ